jgi:hypothetical protein
MILDWEVVIPHEGRGAASSGIKVEFLFADNRER